MATQASALTVARLWRRLAKGLWRRPSGVYEALFVLVDREQQGWVYLRHAAAFFSFLLPFAQPGARAALLRHALSDAVRERRLLRGGHSSGGAGALASSSREHQELDPDERTPLPRRLDQRAFVCLCLDVASGTAVSPVELEQIVRLFSEWMERSALPDAKAVASKAFEAAKHATSYRAARSEALFAAAQEARARRAAVGEAMAAAEEERWRNEAKELMRAARRVEAVRQAATHAEAEKRNRNLAMVASAVRSRVQEREAYQRGEGPWGLD